MHRQYGLYGPIYLAPTAAIATVNTGFVCLHIILKTLTNIDRITKPLNFYLISPQNLKSKYFNKFIY